MILPNKLDSGQKVIITVAPVGSFPTKKDNPNLPITPEEIAAEVYRSYDAGASVVHLHARDLKTQEPTADPGIYRAIVQSVRERCPEIIIQLSTGTGAVKMGLSPQERIRHIEEIIPESASLNAGSMNMQQSVFVNSPETIQLYAQTMTKLKVKPEFEVFDLGMIENIEYLVRRRGLVPEPHSYSLVLGVIGGIPATVKNLVHMVDALPEHCNWQVIAVGRHQIPLGTVGVVMGGGIRVGFEDNVYLSRGILAESNAELVEKAVHVIKEVGREIASSEEARQILQVSKKTSDEGKRSEVL
jgi:3-keto-5-aminohexanoate cleavage enzyme